MVARPATQAGAPIRWLLRAVERRLGLRAPSLLRSVPFDTAGLVIGSSRIIESSRAARRLLGDIAAEGAALDGLLHGLDPEAGSLRAALVQLLGTGRAFRLRTPVGGRGRFEVIGSPQGARCLLTLRDLAGEPEDAAIAAAERRAARAEAEAAALREALGAIPVPVWLLGADGAARWSNPAAQSVGALPVSDETARRFALPDDEAVVVGPSPDGRADQVLRRFVETVSETFAHLRVGLAIFDRDRRLTLSNPAMAEMFQADPRWLSGRPSLRETLDRLREARQLPEQADYPAWRATLFTLFDSGASGTYEDVWELPDGRSLHVIARPHPMGGIAFVFEDITEAVALQRWRSTAVEVRRATLDLLADGVVVLGPDGRVRMANPAFAAQWGLVPDDVPTLHVADLVARCRPLCRDVPLWDRVRAAVASGAGRAPWEARITLTDGRVIKARVAPMPDGSTLVALADITDSEQVAAALRDRAAALESAEQMRDTLVDHLAHRLRTPMNAVSGFADMLGEGRAGELTAMQASFVRHIQQASRQLMDSIESLNDLASIHAASVGNTTGAVAVGPALRGAVGLLARRAEEAGVTLRLAQQTTEAVVWGETGRIRQLVYILVSEAVAAGLDGDILRIGATAEGETVSIWCTGLGAEGVAPSPGSGISAEPDEAGGTRFLARLPVRVARAAG